MRGFLFILLFIFSAQFAVAQRDIEGMDEPSFMDRVYFGGGGTFQMGNQILIIGASPMVGYMLTPRLSAGVGVTYQYTKYGAIDRIAHTYGGRLFTRYNIFRSFYTMAEYEQLSFDLSGGASSELPRSWVDRFMIGGGYFQPFPGGRGGLNIGVLYDVLFQNRSTYPYSSPWVFRVGFTY